ncbi:MAG: response regulator [Syntrophothermus sp.]|nr:response regulator [Ignavibacteriaceae bacterium]
MNKIIVVEDDPFSQHFYTYLLSKAGFNPIVLEDGDKIVNTIQEDEINLVIMDINLKNTYFNGEKVNGIFLSKFIKNNKHLSHIPILLVTAYSPLVKDEEFFHESLAEDYVTKPIVDFNSLLDKVKRLINNP